MLSALYGLFASNLGREEPLYGAQDRLEEAVTFHRQAADIRTRSQNQAAEGRSRNNLAIRLLDLGRHDEA